MESIWENNVSIGKREAFFGEKQVHTVVIGAGMAGILTAYFLQKKGVEVIVVEAKSIAGGQTKNTTAKITSQHGMLYHNLIKKAGRERARAYAMANEEAIYLYEKLIKEEKIVCAFEKLPAYLYSLYEEAVGELEQEAKAAASLGLPAKFVEGGEITELPFAVSGAVCFENQAQFHPLQFIEHLAKGLTVYEDTRVLSVKKHAVYTDKGDITAKNIVFATHYPFINVPGFYFLRQHQERSYVLALKEQQRLSGMYYGVDKNALSLRSVGNTLLLGGGSHRTGKHNAGCYAFLRKMAQKYYPQAAEAYAWAAQDCMPHDKIPFIGQYSMLRPYWYVETGFHKWGMTSAMIAAVTVSDLICRADGQYASVSCESIAGKNVFTPQRCLFRAGFSNWIKDLAESIAGLGKGLFSKKERRCPHMGCRLEWNEEEKSWDCPCHGSRFNAEGKLEDNPAQADLKKQSNE